MRRIRLAAAAVLIGTAVGGGPALAAPAAGREAAPDAAADSYVPLPDLGIAHRHPNGSTILWRLALSELDPDYGRPRVVRSLGSAFPFDRVRVVSGDFGNITAGDDGTADFVLWQLAPDGSLKVWGVGGGRDTTPRLWQTLRAPWSWWDSRPMVGDMNGDGWDDLLVLHKGGTYQARLWVFPSDGRRLGAPRLWSAAEPWVAARFGVGRLEADNREDVLRIQSMYGSRGQELAYTLVESGWDEGWALTDAPGFLGFASQGWSLAKSRQLVMNLTGDDLEDAVTIQQSANGGMVVRGHYNRYIWANEWEFPTFEPPVLWGDLRTGAWSFAASRQYAADTNADDYEDLITLHRSGSGGIVVWRHVNTGSGFAAPQPIVHLRREQGWQWAYSRETVADTWGTITTP